MAEDPIRLSVVVPAYNEEARIQTCLAELTEWLSSFAQRAEIIVVDDGSDPAGRKAAEDALVPLAAQIERRLLRHEQNLGKGAAVRTGCLAARGSYVAFLDADLASPPADLSLLLSALDAGADVAVGVRHHGGGLDMRDRRRWTRRVAGKAFSLLTRTVLSLNTSDTQCPLKAFRHAAAQRLFRLQRINSWSFDAELLFLSQRLNLKVARAPVRWRPMPGSHLKLNLAAAEEIINLFRIRWAHRRVGPNSRAGESVDSSRASP